VSQMQDWATDIGKVAKAELDLPVDKDEKKIILQGEDSDKDPAVKRGRVRTQRGEGQRRNEVKEEKQVIEMK